MSESNEVRSYTWNLYLVTVLPGISCFVTKSFAGTWNFCHSPVNRNVFVSLSCLRLTNCPGNLFFAWSLIDDFWRQKITLLQKIDATMITSWSNLWRSGWLLMPYSFGENIRIYLLHMDFRQNLSSHLLYPHSVCNSPSRLQRYSLSKQGAWSAVL